MRRLVLGAAVALAGVGVFAAVGLGDGSDWSAVLDRDIERVKVHRTDAPSVSASSPARVAKKKKRKPKVENTVESDPIPVSPGISGGFAVACPKKFKAVNGYYGTTGGILADLFAPNPDRKREWLFGFTNVTDADGVVLLGAVCAKNL